MSFTYFYPKDIQKYFDNKDKKIAIVTMDTTENDNHNNK